VYSTYSSDRPLEIVGEDNLQIIPRVDGVFPEALQAREWSGFLGHWEVDDLGGVGAARDLYGRGVAAEPLLRSLLAVILGDAVWFEVL
jgi:hypothetical protein